MNPTFLGYVFLFSVSAIVCLATIPRARSIQHPGTREGLVGLLVSVAIWSGGYVGYLVAPTEASKLAFYLIGFVFAFIAVGAWFYFCAAYTGRPTRDAPYRKFMVGVFLIFVVLKITNPLHNLYFTTEWTTEPFPHLAINHQLLYWVLLGLSYAVVAVGFFMLIERFYHTGADSRPLVILAGVTGLPAVATIAGGSFGGALPLMYEPPGVALFAVGTLFVYFQRFEAIRLTGGADDPAIFLDPDTRIRDYNEPARETFPVLAGSIGKHIEDVSSTLAEQLIDEEILTISRNDDERYYEVARTPFMAGEVETGQLVTVTDVTDRESYRKQLEAKTEQLEALNRVIRHDIRNDMSVIVGWGDTLRKHIDEEGEEALDHVLQSSNHVIELTEIARDFVDSLVEDEATELKPVNIRRHLETELTTVRETYPDAQFDLSGNIPDVSVRANEMLSSVFRNLFENAVQHNDEETPKITVTCTEQDETVQIQIADNGPGVPDSQKTEIFGKGKKGLESSGTGIGLYLVHTLTSQFGGEVWVEDNDPKGAVFVVTLPKVVPHEQEGDSPEER